VNRLSFVLSDQALDPMAPDRFARTDLFPVTVARLEGGRVLVNDEPVALATVADRGFQVATSGRVFAMDLTLRWFDRATIIAADSGATVAVEAESDAGVIDRTPFRHLVTFALDGDADFRYEHGTGRWIREGSSYSRVTIRLADQGAA
jgi:hypothetical protein